MEVSFTPYTANDWQNNFWEPDDDEGYDSGRSGQDYFPTDDDSTLLHNDASTEDSDEFGMIVGYTAKGNVTCIHVPVMVHRTGQ